MLDNNISHENNTENNNSYNYSQGNTSNYQGNIPNYNVNNSYPNDKITNKFALSSLICGLLSIWIFGIPFGITAIILGIIALNTFDLATEKNESFAIAGIIIGVIAVVVCMMNIMTYY